MHEIADIACNFTSERFDNDLDEVIDRAIVNNITKFALICSRLSDLNKLLEIYNQYSKDMFFTIGVHPHHANEINDEYLKNLKESINNNNPHAIGETGLDFFRNLSTYEEQVYAFEEQIKIAIDTNKPLFLHQRDSHDDFIKILKKYSSEISKAVVHCFTGTQEQLDDYLELDCYIGVTGWICDEKRNVELRKTIKNIPLEKLMIETDCPYLIPKNIVEKPKNNRNEPSNLNHIVAEIGMLMGIDEDALRKETYINTKKFFNTK
ncbi:MAG: hydrolase TatD [Gammaproteobacteria bacterium]|nr:hydrolase TatD [Gammaproteobacteria bacterium]|tara:strand:- start:539 stop:1330 length:792 start_codon:yes stop_codon:yes gene_type:complete